jgi:hypothetical protein
MNQNYDQIFGPGGRYAWPADLDVAEALIRAALSAKSSADCLNDWFFSHMLGFDQEYEGLRFNEDEIDDLVEAKVESTQELFKDAKNWPLPYLVGSAVYHIVSKNTEKIHMISHVWHNFLWLFLLFDEPLVKMFRGKGWDKIYKNSIREGFKWQLKFEIQGLTNNRLLWSSNKDKPWFACRYFTSRIYPEDVLRCLDLVGIDRDLAHLAVDQMFKLQSLTPFYDVLLDNPSLIAAIFPKIRRYRGEEERTESSKESSADLRIHIFNFVYGTLLFAAAAIASTRFRSLRSNCTSIAQVQRQPGPCFAAVSMRRNVGTSYRHAPFESSERPLRQPSSNVADVTASASHQVGPRLSLASLRKQVGLIRARWEIAALRNQPSVQAIQEQQPSKTEKALIKLVKNLYHKIATRQKNWYKDGKILTEESPEMKGFRADLKVRGKRLPDNTLLCFHLKKTKTEKGKNVIELTTQGTLANCNVQKKILKWAQKYFTIDNQIVVIGGSPGSYENDHIVFSILGEVTDLRNSSTPSQDRGVTIKVPANIHVLRTHNPVLKELTFDLKNLTQSLPLLLKPTQEADHALWIMKKHEVVILEAGLTPDLLVKRYDLAHKQELGRMTCNLKEDGFHPKQATAFVVDKMLESSIKLSIKEFVCYQPTPPILEDESVLSKRTSFQVERADRCYFTKIRLYNLVEITRHFADYTKLSHTLELYSQSPEGLKNGCNISQTQQHRKTKIKAIHGFEEALEDSKIPYSDAKEALNDTLVSAIMDKDGNLKEGLLPIEEVKDRIYTIGEHLKINSLYKRQSVFSMKQPSVIETQKMYKECVQSAATKPRDVPEQDFLEPAFSCDYPNYHFL